MKAFVFKPYASKRNRHLHRQIDVAAAVWNHCIALHSRIGNRVYRYFRSRDIDSVIKTLTVKRDTLGDIYICFSVETDPETVNHIATGKMAGADFGLKTFLTLSDGNVITSPEPLKSSLKALKEASRKLSRKKKGSTNRKKAGLNLARASYGEASARGLPPGDSQPALQGI